MSVVYFICDNKLFGLSGRHVETGRRIAMCGLDVGWTD